MTIFHSYVSLPGGILLWVFDWNLHVAELSRPQDAFARAAPEFVSDLVARKSALDGDHTWICWG